MKKLIIIFSLFLLSSCKTTSLTTSTTADMIISDDFTKDRLHQYDKSHIYYCIFNCGSYKAYQFLKENNGNQFIRLTSKHGQLSKYNSNKRKYLKDRIELGTTNLYLGCLI